MKTDSSFDLMNTYVFLQDSGCAPRIEVTETFWRDLMSGNATSAGAALVANGAGWLTAIYRMERDTPTWEMHPAGDELFVLLSGAIDIVLEREGGNRIVKLREGQSCLGPRGTWHKQMVRTHGRDHALTDRKDT